MPRSLSRRQPAGRPPQAEHASATARRLLEAAGQVFAAKGFAGATGKEICDRAGANAAAVNYHFGGIQGLYSAVVHEAHERLVTREALAAAVASEADPEAQLAAFYRLLIQTLTGPASGSWALRVLSREIVAPTDALETLRQREILPKVSILKGIVGQLMNLPIDDPAVDRGCLCVMGPCFMLLVGDRRTLKRAFPNFGFDAKEAAAVAEQFVAFALAGLNAARAQGNAAPDAR